MDQSKKGFLVVLPGVKLSKTQSPTTTEDRKRMKVSAKMTPMESLGFLLRLAGAGLCKERVWQEAHISFTQVRAARMRNTLVLLWCMYLSVLVFLS